MSTAMAMTANVKSFTTRNSAESNKYLMALKWLLFAEKSQREVNEAWMQCF